MRGATSEQEPDRDTSDPYRRITLHPPHSRLEGEVYQAYFPVPLTAMKMLLGSPGKLRVLPNPLHSGLIRRKTERRERRPQTCIERVLVRSIRIEPNNPPAFTPFGGVRQAYETAEKHAGRMVSSPRLQSRSGGPMLSLHPLVIVALHLP
jgi:hypothetical protein